ncbi:hypothetical protein LTS18_009211, partial [Coniosporium uncinatum]
IPSGPRSRHPPHQQDDISQSHRCALQYQRILSLDVRLVSLRYRRSRTTARYRHCEEGRQSLPL